MSHEDPNVVDEVIELMKTHFGDLTITRGNEHRFLGMNIKINKKKCIEIEMREDSKRSSTCSMKQTGVK